MNLTPYIIIPLVEVIFCLALFINLMLVGRKHIARRPFAIFLVGMGVWGFCIYMMRVAPDLESALFWERLVFFSIIISALVFYYFTFALTGTHQSNKIVYSIYAYSILVLALVPTNLVLQGMQLLWYGKAPVIGPLFPFYVLGVYVPIMFALAILIKHRRASRINDERTRDQYIISGIFIMLIGGTTDYLPSLGINLYPLGIIGNLIFCIFATVAMLKYDLLEMKVVLRKGAAYTLVSMIVFGIFGSLIFLASRLFQQLVSPISVMVTGVAVFIIAAIFRPVFVGLQHSVDRWFFRKQYDHLQVLKRFAKETKGNLDLRQLSSSFVTAVANGMQSNGVYLLLPSPVNRQFVTYASSGQKSHGRFAFVDSSPLMVTMKYQERLVDSNDMDIIPSLNSLTEGDRQTLANNDIELMVPLKNNARLVGMLLIARKLSGEPYSNEERHLLQNTSDEVAVNIENANRYEVVKREHGEMQKAMEGVIYAVSLVVETRDPYTAGHQRRVAELARAIGREMGLSEWDIKGILIAGLLHDVGKVAVPAEILSKPGKINEYEFNIIKNHARVGYEILKRIEFPWPVPKAILQHHERLDGSGYPDGLGGKNIILEARILGVADVVEAMSSHRPYRPALGVDKAVAEISRARNVLYDGNVVDACLRLISKDGFEFESLVSAAKTNGDILSQIEELTR